MIPLCRRLFFLLTLFTCLPRLTGCMYYPLTKATAMNTSEWKTHCVGRFLLDLPPDASLGYRTDLRTQMLEREGMTIEDMRNEAKQFIATLKAQKHEKYPSRLVRRVDLPNGGLVIYYFLTDYAEYAAIKAWLVPAQSYAVFSWHSKDPLALDAIDTYHVPLLRKLTGLLRERSQVDLSVTPGICVDCGGFIIGKTIGISEAFNLGVSFANHPGVVFSLDGYIQRSSTSTTLLERIGLVPGLLAALSGAHTLRKGQRNIGPILGEEYLLATTHGGILRPNFMWDVPGQINSVDYPRLRAMLTFTDESVKTSPFTSNKQALELWDTILQSIRLRITP